MEAPKLPTIFKQNRSRGFTYQPIYYNEEKERKEELQRKIEGKDPEGFAENFRSQFRMERSRNTGKPSSRSSNIRLLVILALLFLVTYLILTY